MEIKNELAPSSFAAVAGALHYQLRLESMLSSEASVIPPAASVSLHTGNSSCVLHLAFHIHYLQSIGQCRHLSTFGWRIPGCDLQTTIILAPLLGAWRQWLMLPVRC